MGQNNTIFSLGMLIICCAMVHLVTGYYQMPAKLQVYAEVDVRTELNATMEMYQVQEFVDLGARPNNKGVYQTVRTKNEKTGQFATYYFTNSEPRYTAILKFDEQESTCSLTDFEKWDLKGVWYMLRVLPLDALRYYYQGTIRLALFAIEIWHKKLKLKHKAFDKRRQIYLDYYVATFDLPQALVQRTQQKVVKMIVATAQSSNNNSLEYNSRFALNDNFPVRVQLLIMDDANSDDSPGEINSKKFFESSETALGITVDYFVAQPIEDMNGLNSPALGANNPLTLPIGIGCGQGQSDGSIILSSSDKFSGHYLIGGVAPSFIAYDQYTATLRIDQWSTKTIYDFTSNAFYNIDLSTTTSPKSNANDGSNVLLEDTVCAVTLLDLQFLNRLGYVGMETILGFGPRQPVTRMGTTEYDGLECDIYEIQLTKSSLAPLVFGHLNLSNAFKHYLVIYYINLVAKSNSAGDKSGYIKRLELRSSNDTTKERNIIKMITFTSFSWSLDVTPAQSASLVSSNRAVQLFDTPECTPMRNSQMLLKFSLEASEGKDLLTTKNMNALKSHVNIVEDTIMQKLVYKLKIPRSRITELESTYLEDSLLISVKLIEAPLFLTFYKQQNWYLEDDNNNLPLASWSLANINKFACITLAGRYKKAIQTVRYCPQTGLCSLYARDAKTLFGEKIKILNSAVSAFDSNAAYNNTCIVSEINTMVNNDHSRMGISLEDTKFLTRYLDDISFSIVVTPPEIKSLTLKVSNLMTRRLEELNEQEVLSNLTYLGRQSKLVQDGGDENKNQIKLIVLELNKRRGIIFCQRACSLERSCMSYSFCKYKQNNVCALSSLVLDKKNLDKLVVAQAKSINELTDRFEYTDKRYPNEIFYFNRDNQCTLHRLDTFSQYGRNKGYLIVSGANDRVLSKGVTVKSLEECALSSRKTLVDYEQVNFDNYSFTFCPLQSLCIHSNQVDAINVASSYAASITENNNNNNNNNKSSDIATPSVSNESNVDEDKDDDDMEKVTNITVKKWQDCMVYNFDLMNFYIKEASKYSTIDKEIKDDEVTKTLFGLSERQCSLECLYGDAACISYDYCRKSDSLLSSCQLNRMKIQDSDLVDAKELSPEFLFKIQSDTRKENSNSGITTNGRNVLSINTCNHYHLTKQNIAVKYFLESYKWQKYKHLPSDEKAINEILEMQSESNIDRLNKYLQQLAGIGKQKMASVGMQILMFAIGALIGIVLILNSDDIFKRLVNLLDDFERRRRQQTSTRQKSFSHVTLTDNFA